MRIYQVAEDEKCGGCNWRVANLYFASDSQEQADAMYRENERGLCADCLIELFQEEGYEILTPDTREEVGTAVDKLLDLEARQETKTLTDTEFGILENLLIKVAG